MLLTSVETAQRLEEADALNISRQITACAQLFPNHTSSTVPIGSGVAAYTLPLLSRKLNRVMGYGMTGPVSEQDLINVEDLYAKNGMDTAITLCPLADPSVIKLLSSRGYLVDMFLHSYVRVLTDEDLKKVEVEGIKISRVPAEKAQDFPKLSVAGYKDGGRAEEILETLARIAMLRADTSIYIATVDGKVAASAGMALIETSKGGVAHMYIDSTVPEFRGRGIQAALLKARLADAREAGFDIASAAARPGNGSCRNIERAGFSVAYTKAWFTKAAK